MAGDDEGRDVTGELTEAELRELFAAVDASEFEAVDEMLAAVEARVRERGGPGNAEKLRAYWLSGAGARTIRWGTHGSFERCVTAVDKYMPGKAEGYCANLHHAATGRWPGAKANGRGGSGPATPVRGRDMGRKGRKKRRRESDMGTRTASEAMIGGKWSYGDVRDMVRDALKASVRQQSGATGYVWVSVVDLTDTDVVYCDDLDGDDLWQCSYTMDDAGNVTLGAAERVVRTYAPAPAGMPADDDAPGQPGAADGLMAAEAHRELGRVLEAKGAAADGGRRFAVEVIRAGDSRNGRRYPLAVLEAAAPRYEGAQVYDGHRSDDQMRTSAINGLVGYLTGVTATAQGLEADLSLLPSAARVAEALDAALELTDRADPFVGLSHDVMARFRPVQESGRTVQEATEITAVNSVDVVAVPAAGGRATRVLAGGEDPTPDDPAPAGETAQEEDVPVTKADVLGVLKEATDDELSGVGLARAGTKTTDPKPATEAAEPDAVPRDSIMGRFLVRQAAEAAGLPAAAVDRLTQALPDRITEADVAAQVSLAQDIMAAVEPIPGGRGPVAEVTQESREKKTQALDAFFARDFVTGYRSFREAYIDFTGQAPRSFGEDFNRQILRESLGTFDSARVRESADTTTWNLALGDSITRRMVAEYGQPSLQTWRTIVSSIVPVNDFRTQRIDRIGGYGTLPAVNQGAPYQPLTTPTNEEVTYAVTKRGGTEDVTLEMIANDDVRAISRIPSKLGLAAAQTLYRFVWDFLDTNPNIYDSNALFTVGGAHSNSATTALSQSALSAARLALRSQAAYGDSTDILSLIPRTLVVANDVEEIAYQLATSAVAIPATPAGPTDTPNIHQGLQVVVVDYWTSTTKWIVVADPMLCPTVELGFYQGRENPELFTQSDPNFGSVFDADKVTWKIRQIYSGAVVDYRGLYRGNV